MAQNLGREREIGIDIIKTLATLFVITIHALQSSLLTEFALNEMTFVLASMMRLITMTCIPLFLLATGYLNSVKQSQEASFKKIKPLLISYVMAVAISILVDITYHNIPLTFEFVVKEFLDLKTQNYAWYARMYFVFFFFIPYVNKLLQSLESKKHFQRLVITLVLASSLPPFVNGLANQLGLPISLPDFFVLLYPFTYYVIGAYIRRHRPMIRKWKVTSLFITITCVSTIVLKAFFSDSKPLWNIFGSYGSLLYLILACSLFILLYDLKVHNKRLSKITYTISSYTFDIYLITHVFDRIIYPIYRSYTEDMRFGLLFIFLPIIISFAFSTLYAHAKRVVLKAFELTTTNHF